MDQATQSWILGIAGVIIMLLLTGNGFWISRLVSSIDKLSEKLDALELSGGKQEEKFNACKSRCESHSDVVDGRLNSHSATLKQHGDDILILKQKSNASKA